MSLAHDTNHDEEGSNPDVIEPGQVAPGGRAYSKLWLAADNRGVEESSVSNNAAQAGITDFLVKRQAAVLEILAEFADQESLSAALFAVTNELQQRFQCDRVAFGLNKNGRVEIAAISQQAVLETRSDEVRLLREAMQEACDQETIVNFTGASESHLVAEAHRALMMDIENSHICTIPLCDKERIVGTLLMQRQAEQSWSRMTLELLTQIAMLLAPLIAMRCEAERSVLSLLRMRTVSCLDGLIGPRRLVAKASVVLIAVLGIVACFLPVSYHVKATAEIVPTERRVISAPTNGFISSVFVNAGDQVRAGDPLISLDTRELELVQASQENEVRSARADLRSAMASYDRKEMAIAQAKLDQIEAELTLTRQRLSRTRMTAPIDGVIVSGDLSQSLGMSVERGKVLLEMAPVEGYEVHIQVDEVDVPYVQIGQTGQLSLEADPGNELAVKVSAIHPIAQASGGSNRFLIETDLVSQVDGLRPGQTGLVKLDAGEASLMWVWTHRFLEWSLQRLWEWTG